jgi:hypothetical protein
MRLTFALNSSIVKLVSMALGQHAGGAIEIGKIGGLQREREARAYGRRQG